MVEQELVELDMALENTLDADLKVESEDSVVSSNIHPWDPDKIRILTKHFTLREVVDQISDKEIDLAPDFQRGYVWEQKQKVKLIESVLLGIPLPAFYFNQDTTGIYQIVDGVQRLNTICSFMKDEYSLNVSYLEYLKNLDNKKYSELSPLDARRFRSTQIVVHVIEPSTPEAIKYDIFSRVNTLGSPLRPQEIRHAMSKERSRSLLKDLVTSDEFDKSTNFNFWRIFNGEKERDSGRMTDRELALRFCAFKSSTLEDYRKYESLDRFLIDYTRRLDGKKPEEISANPIDDQELGKIKTSFLSAMRSAHDILGENAFRRIEVGKKRGPINRAIFESQSIALSDYSHSDLMKKSEKVREALLNLFQDPDYTKSVTVSTGSSMSVATRLQKPRQVLKELLE